MRRYLLRALAGMLLGLLCAQGVAAEYGDITFLRKTPGPAEFPPAVYPHWIHRMQFRCYVCHQSIFKMKRGSNPVTMDDIDGGKYCGVCHNGKIAFGTSFGQCFHCHHK